MRRVHSYDRSPPTVRCREILEETGLAVTVRATGPITLAEHDDAAWADPGDLPAVSDETRALLAGRRAG
ncbi:NUDIX hydrolase [Streptomyces sp. CBMAI 2042]|uniref:hypothetical protein n=1 Tax=Streptomyces sp. CBMAI 2042 TaxID=2305222 RepID=UPI001F34C075|nr:hypothetical protein [Streptomyces sp. CBMAI 2042]